MKMFTAYLSAALFLFSIGSHQSHAHYCAKCVKIETERAEVQAKEGPHAMRYADDLIQTADGQGDVLKVAPAQKNNAAPSPEIGAGSPSLSTILDVLEIKNFINVLAGSFTIFIPSDEAVRNFPYASFMNMLRPENRELLFAVVSNHIVAQEILKGDFNKGFKTLGGRVVELQSNGQGLTVNGAKVLESAPVGNSGIVYVIDQVMIPIHE